VQIIHLILLNCRLGHIEDAQKHLSLATAQPDLLELHKLQTVEKHLGRCLDSRKAGDWKSVLRECDAAIAAGADSSALVRFCPSSTTLIFTTCDFLIQEHVTYVIHHLQLFASRAEALLRLNQLDEADMAISSASKLDYYSSCASDTKFCGFFANAYLYYAHAQVDIALGR
jgi:hypothetical protein